MDQKKLSKKTQLKLISFFVFAVFVSIISIPIFSNFLPKSGRIEGVSTTQCIPTPLGIAQDYNMFVLNDMTETAVDTQGRVAVGGNATYLNYAVGAALSNSSGKRDDLIVGKVLNFTNGSILNGNIVYGVNFKLDKVSVPHGTTKKGSPINFTTAASDLKSRSNFASTLKVNGKKIVGKNILTLTGTDLQFNVFNITAAELAPNITFTIDVPATSTVLVNVNGTNAQFRYLGFNLKGVKKQNILYNFYNATKIQIDSIGIQGSVLAPNADVQFDNGNIDGTMIVNSLKGTGEGHHIPFTGCLLNTLNATVTETTTATTNPPGVIIGTSTVTSTTITSQATTTTPVTTVLTTTPVTTRLATTTIQATSIATTAITTTPITILVTTTPILTTTPIATTIVTTTPVTTVATTTVNPTTVATTTTSIATNTTSPTATNVLGVSTGPVTATPQQRVLGATTQIASLPNTGTSENVMAVVLFGFGLVTISGMIFMKKPKSK